jgi:hypothetical protein
MLQLHLEVILIAIQDLALELMEYLLLLMYFLELEVVGEELESIIHQMLAKLDFQELEVVEEIEIHRLEAMVLMELLSFFID